MSANELPALTHLSSETDRSRIIAIRDSVAPILANNLLPHFTDHSVSHSDNLTRVVDDLISTLQRTDKRLSVQELTLLYAACYLHDVGLQFERAGETVTIGQLRLEPPWELQGEAERRELLRRYHHLISAELIATSFNKEFLHLPADLDVARIANLCEAHNLWLEVDEDRKRYLVLTSDGPNIRMSLIAGILRVGDILEESRRRASRDKARTLLLPIVSQMHWWRHYYTENITFNEDSRTIEVWFDFPPDRDSEYRRIVPDLQLPEIEAELRRHELVFGRNGLNWSVVKRFQTKPYGNAEQMPDEVLVAMLSQLQKKYLAEEQRQKAVILSAFRESRPYIKRKIDELAERKEKTSVADSLIERFEIANDLWEIGSKRSAIMEVVFAFEKDSASLELEQRIEIGSRLLGMILEEGTLQLAQSWILSFQMATNAMDPPSENSRNALGQIAEYFVRSCAYEQAIQATVDAMETLTDETRRSELSVIMKEMHLLQGELELTIDDTCGGQ